MIIANVNIFTPEFEFRRGTIGFEDRINSVELTGPEDSTLPYCIPGLIDIHTHGNSGYDFGDASPEGLDTMGRYYAYQGVTSFAGTAATLPVAQLEKACRNGVRYAKNRGCGAHLRGIHLEGPHFSFRKRGAQNPDYLLPPDLNVLKRLSEASEGLLRITAIAPELEGAAEYIRKASQYMTVSLAHTECDYKTAYEAYENGASHLTHTFNGMMPVTGREPGPILAALEHPGCFAEIIGDGKHVAPACVRMLFRLFGAARMVLISDSLSCCGMAEGNCLIAGREITVRDGLGYLKDGTIAGAANNLFQDLKAAVSFGIPRSDAIRAATLNPAKVLKADRETGSIEVSKDADLVICDSSFNISEVFVSGRKVR